LCFARSCAPCPARNGAAAFARPSPARTLPPLLPLLVQHEAGPQLLRALATKLNRRSCRSYSRTKQGRCSCASLPDTELCRSCFRSLSGKNLRRCREGALLVQLGDEVGRLGRSPEPVEITIARDRDAYEWMLLFGSSPPCTL
jgi:hypothetical protein